MSGCGNAIAAKIQIAHDVWIMRRIRIMFYKYSKQNSLGLLRGERVGISNKPRKYAV